MSEYFDGTYYKHQLGNNVLCLIVGGNKSKPFLQVVTKDFSCSVPLSDGNIFSDKGIKLDVATDNFSLSGELVYDGLTPIKYDIMGPFKYFPMECRHGIVSMRHKISGSVKLCDKEINLTGAIGYIERDSGTSFPSSYMWVQANDFDDDTSVVASVADIPFCKLHFMGCICVVMHKGKEYRLATYLGVRVLCRERNRLVLKQGKYRLEVSVEDSVGQRLKAPRNGEMDREIIESASCCANFDFYKGKVLLFSKKSHHAGFEFCF